MEKSHKYYLRHLAYAIRDHLKNRAHENLRDGRLVRHLDSISNLWPEAHQVFSLGIGAQSPNPEIANNKIILNYVIYCGFYSKFRI